MAGCRCEARAHEFSRVAGSMGGCWEDVGRMLGGCWRRGFDRVRFQPRRESESDSCTGAISGEWERDSVEREVEVESAIGSTPRQIETATN